METFIHNIDELVKYFNSRKDNIVRYLKKHFKENIDYIVLIETKKTHNHKIYLLTEETYNLCLSSFNIKNRYNPFKQQKTLMSLENQTIGFITNIYRDIVKFERQKKFDSYFVDLYFEDYNLVVECDELGHKDRDIFYEEKRENYIKSLGNTFIRFNPNEENFDLSNAIQKINKIIFKV